jgi:hypothetical protein
LERYRSVDERVYAALRDCPLQTVRNDRYLQRGCPFYKIPGCRSVRYRLADILAFLEQGRVETRVTTSRA